MAKEYLDARDNKCKDKSQALLKELPFYVKQFYDAKKDAKSEHTRYFYIMDIRDFLAYLSPTHHISIKEIPFELLDELTVQDIDEYKNILSEKYAPASVKRKLASISSFYKYLVLAGFVKNNPASIIDWPKEDQSKAIVYLDDAQTAKLLNGIYANSKQIYYLNEDGDTALSSVKDKDAVKGNAKNKYTEYIVRDIDEITRKRREKVRLRNYCIVLLFLKTGMRVSELVSIDLYDIDMRKALIYVTGKGNKIRPVGFGEPAIVSVLKEYINTDRKILTRKNKSEKALFVSTAGKRVSVRNIESMIKEMVQTYLSDEETIKIEDFSPHKLRSTCATRLLNATDGDLKGVSELLGHKSIQITARAYAAVKQEENAVKMAEYQVSRPQK